MPIDGQPRTIVKELDDMARQYIKVGFGLGPGRVCGGV